MNRGERGAAATEWAILFPVFIMLIGVMVAGARYAQARAGIAEAAGAAARAASIARDAGSAKAAADAVIASNLAGTACQSRTVAVDLSGFAVPVGQPARVRVSIRCTVPLGDVVVPGMPGSVTVSADATSALDRYRSRR